MNKLKPYLKEFRQIRAETILDIDSIHTDFLAVITTPDTLVPPDSNMTMPIKVYSMYVGSDIKNAIFNIYLEEFEDGTLTDPYVLMFRMDSTFAEEYYSEVSGHEEFVGAVSKHEMETLFGDVFRGGDIDLAIIQRCWEIVFGEPLDITILGHNDDPSLGGSSEYPPNRPPAVPGVGTFPAFIPEKPGGASSDGCYRISPSSPDGTFSIYWDEGCDDPPRTVPMAIWGGGGETSGSRDPFYLECIRLLVMCHVIERPLTPLDPSQLTLEETIALELGFEYATTEYFDIVDCLGKNKPLTFAVQDLMNSLIDPCNPTVEPEDILRDALEAACGSEGIVEELYDALSEEDYIIELYSFQNNQKIKCIWDKLNTQDELYCETLGNFYESPVYDLVLAVGALYDKCAAFRSILGSTGRPGIVFDPGCIADRTTIELVKTILHEGIHAEIFRIIQATQEYGTLSEDDYPELWEAYRTHKDWNHDFMATWYLEKLATALGEYDQWTYSYAHYKALAWQGLDINPNTGHPITTVWNNMSSAEKQAIIALRNELLNNAELNCQ